MSQYYRRINDPSDIRDLSDVMPGWLASNNPKANAWEPCEPPVEPEPPAPTFTAEGWLDAQGYGGARPTTLLYLKLQLQGANKSSTKLAAAQAWLDGIIFVGAQNPDAQHADLPAAPYGFAETCQEALAQLTGGQ